MFGMQRSPLLRAARAEAQHTMTPPFVNISQTARPPGDRGGEEHGGGKR
jgi:hypothetical protein